MPFQTHSCCWLLFHVTYQNFFIIERHPVWFLARHLAVPDCHASCVWYSTPRHLHTFPSKSVPLIILQIHDILHHVHVAFCKDSSVRFCYGLSTREYLQLPVDTASRHVPEHLHLRRRRCHDVEYSVTSAGAKFISKSKSPYFMFMINLRSDATFVWRMVCG